MGKQLDIQPMYNSLYKINELFKNQKTYKTFEANSS